MERIYDMGSIIIGRDLELSDKLKEIFNIKDLSDKDVKEMAGGDNPVIVEINKYNTSDVKALIKCVFGLDGNFNKNVDDFFVSLEKEILEKNITHGSKNRSAKIRV